MRTYMGHHYLDAGTGDKAWRVEENKPIGLEIQPANRACRVTAIIALAPSDPSCLKQAAHGYFPAERDDEA